MKPFVVPLAFAVSLLAAGRKLPSGFEPIAQLALATPPEFASDALLRLSESGRITDKDTTVDLIQQAFDLGANARFRVRLRALAGNPMDTRQGSLAKAHAMGLDALTLQSRAVLAMINVDAARARQLFQAMGKPDLAPLKCEDALVYDVAIYYRALAAVVQSGFTGKERAKEDHVAFLLEYTSQVRSPAQVAPMAASLQSAGLTPQQRDLVIVRFNGQLEAISGDARSFAASLNEASAAVTPDMEASFRKYVDKNSTNVGCEDGLRVTVQIDSGQPPKPGSAAKTDPYWQSDAAQRVLDGARKLRFGPQNVKVLSDAERSASEWLQQLGDFDRQVAGWAVASEKSEADYYHQKCIVYQAMVELIPPGAERDKVLQSFIGFVTGSNLQQQSPVEWFLPAAAMLERVRNTNGGEPGKVLSAFEASGSPVLALHSMLERVFERALPSWVAGSR